MDFPENMDDFVTLDELDNTAGDSLGMCVDYSCVVRVCVCVRACINYNSLV